LDKLKNNTIFVRFSMLSRLKYEVIRAAEK